MHNHFKWMLGFLLYGSVAHASWICNVENLKGGHWTFVAPTEAAANTLAKNACDANSLKASNCNPSCADNGAPNGRWHCVVANRKGEHWSFIGPNHNQIYAMAKRACANNSLNPESCEPNCIPE